MHHRIVGFPDRLIAILGGPASSVVRVARGSHSIMTVWALQDSRLVGGRRPFSLYWWLFPLTPQKICLDADMICNIACLISLFHHKPLPMTPY